MIHEGLRNGVKDREGAGQDHTWEPRAFQPVYPGSISNDVGASIVYCESFWTLWEARRPRDLSLGCLSCQGVDKLSAEIRDVRHDAAPDEVVLAEGGLVDPGSPGVDEIVLDALGPGGAVAFDDAGGNQHKAGVADGADDLALLVRLPN